MLKEVLLSLSTLTNPNPDIAKGPSMSDSIPQDPNVSMNIAKQYPFSADAGVFIRDNTVFILSSDPKPSPTTTIESSESPQDPVLAETRKLGIGESELEKELWNLDFYLTDEEMADLSPQEIAFLADEKVLIILDNMYLSENPYFNRAANFFLRLSDDGRLGSIWISDEYWNLYEDWISEDTVLIGESSANEENDLIMIFSFNPRKILSADPFELAHGLTHFSVMGIDANRKLKSLPEGLTQEEIDEEMVGTLEEQISLFSEALATQADSCIHQSGLVGMNACGSHFQEGANTYIETGGEGPEWRRFIESTLGIAVSAISTTHSENLT